MQKETNTFSHFLANKTYWQFVCEDREEGLNMSKNYEWARRGDRWFHNGFEVKKDAQNNWIEVNNAPINPIF